MIKMTAVFAALVIFIMTFVVAGMKLAELML